MQLSYHYLVLEDPHFVQALRQQVSSCVPWGNVATVAIWLPALAGENRVSFQPLERQYFDRSSSLLPTARKKFPLFAQRERTGFVRSVGRQGDVQYESDGKYWGLFKDIQKRAKHFVCFLHDLEVGAIEGFCKRGLGNLLSQVHI